jgi:hypothetical protein
LNPATGVTWKISSPYQENTVLRGKVRKLRKTWGERRLSPSTEAYDRGKKAKLYRAIPSLQELLLIAQDSYEVELYRRQGDGTWSLIEAKGLESAIALTSIGYTLSLRELYEKVIGDSENAEPV